MTTREPARAFSTSGDDPRLEAAARNIASLVGAPPSGSALVVCCGAKARLAAAVAGVLRGRGIEAHVLELAERVDRQGGRLTALVGSVAGYWGLVVLPGPGHAEWLFETVGRPDRGVRSIPHLFCDWLLPADSLLPVYAVDMAEQARFRQRLLERLRGARRVRITTPAGTDLELTPRDWDRPDLTAWGEVYTAPVEDSVHGSVVVDGSAYSGPPTPPFALRIEGGRVTNLAELSTEDPHQRLALADLTRDAAASVVAELGLGVSASARADAHIMEAEQARGTCHVGFGHNLAYGGRNESATHTDFCCLQPTILADAEAICRDGVYAL